MSNIIPLHYYRVFLGGKYICRGLVTACTDELITFKVTYIASELFRSSGFRVGNLIDVKVGRCRFDEIKPDRCPICGAVRVNGMCPRANHERRGGYRQGKRRINQNGG